MTSLDQPSTLQSLASMSRIFLVNVEDGSIRAKNSLSIDRFQSQSGIQDHGTNDCLVMLEEQVQGVIVGLSSLVGDPDIMLNIFESRKL